MYKYIITLSLLSRVLVADDFIPPIEKWRISGFAVSADKGLSLRKIELTDKTLFEEITLNEKMGILGYHGNSLDFMIYQDIIRMVIEEIVGISIRADFCFLSPPFDPAQKIQTKKELADVFTHHNNPSIVLYNSTFPLNFSLYDNPNRLGHNTIEKFMKNESVKPLGYERRLKWFFLHLGMSENKIRELFEESKGILAAYSETGIILQIFDTSEYAFSKQIAYPAYPNGFIADNVTVDEYFMAPDRVPPNPHEVRLMLNNSATLNPHNPLQFIRYTPGVPEQILKKYQHALRSRVKELVSQKERVKKYRNDLLKAWE